MRQRLVGAHRAAVLAVEVLGREAVVVRGHVGQQHARRQRAVLQHGRVQQRLEDAAGAARPADDVHRIAPRNGVRPHLLAKGARAACGRAGVSDVRQHFEGLVVDDQRGGVVHLLARQHARRAPAPRAWPRPAGAHRAWCAADAARDTAARSVSSRCGARSGRSCGSAASGSASARSRSSARQIAGRVQLSQQRRRAWPAAARDCATGAPAPGC